LFLTKYKTYDLVIPLFHGIYGEDGQITAFLKTLGCSYAYSPFATHALCLDKYQSNLFVEKMGIKIPITHFIENYSDLPVFSEIDYPYIVKPNH
jgi:D-alanine-D-alanine ligase-like ATP-grasp enzyme